VGNPVTIGDVWVEERTDSLAVEKALLAVLALDPSN
jgi:hypothetical protein